MGWYIFDISQSSIVGPFLFNLYICNLFYEIIDLEYPTLANGTTPCTCLQTTISPLAKL